MYTPNKYYSKICFSSIFFNSDQSLDMSVFLRILLVLLSGFDNKPLSAILVRVSFSFPFSATIDLYQYCSTRSFCLLLHNNLGFRFPIKHQSVDFFPVRLVYYSGIIISAVFFMIFSSCPKHLFGRI